MCNYISLYDIIIGEQLNLVNPRGPEGFRGEPSGHFVVLAGYRTEDRHILVADPLKDNPRFATHYYAVSMDRLLAAILLGIVTYDANLLVIEPA